MKGEWHWQSNRSDCNFDRAATGAAIEWDDRNGVSAADTTRTITAIERQNNVVTFPRRLDLRRNRDGDDR